MFWTKRYYSLCVFAKYLVELKVLEKLLPEENFTQVNKGNSKGI